jgi:lysophospholipase L1-like esterase
MKTILFYGDSNTYGFDPRGWFSERYDRPWPMILQASLDTWNILSDGLNGRTVPDDLTWVKRDLEQDIDIFAVMLGTNDIYCGYSLEKILDRMKKLCTYAKKHAHVLLMTPPAMMFEQERMAELNTMYQQLADEMELSFLDTSQWEIDLAYDGVHFSEKGHEQFAQYMQAYLETI